MLDIKFIREHFKEVEKNNKRRGSKVDLKEITDLDDKRLALIKEAEELRHQINVASKQKPTPEEIKKLREVGEKAKKLEGDLKEVEGKLFEKMSWLPNILSPEVPDGKSGDDNVEVRKWGEPKKFDFKARDHVELGKILDVIDIDRATKVSGARYYYLKNEAVLMELALVDFALKYLIKQGFTPFITPEVAKERTLFGTGYLPFFAEDIYKIEKEDLSLIGTSEQTLVAYHADEILEEKDLPLKYVGFSSCFRTEAGSYGKDVRGILRVHQFDKVEQILFTTPETSEHWHNVCQENEEYFFKELGIPYRVVKICVGDFGAPGYLKYDVEAWLPGQEKYREVTSNTNITSFQTRRLNIRFRKKNGGIDYPHTISATGIAIGRAIIAILENYQQEDGSIVVPKVLRDYMGMDIIRPKK